MTLGAKSTAKEVVDFFKANLKGKVAVVTGGNSGIGEETCKALCAAGAKVILCCRQIASGVETVEKYIKVEGKSGYAVPDAQVVVKQLDLADLHSVKRLAGELIAEEPVIDLFVLNAGIMMCPLEYTKQGFESQIGVNHFGHHYFTTLMMDRLKASKARVVVVSSSAHQFHKLQFDDLHFKNSSYSATTAYGNSKMANILFAKSLDDQGLRAVSLHPGVIRTNLARHIDKWILWKAFRHLIWAFGKTVPQGAATTLYACLSPEFQDKGGHFLHDCKIQTPTRFGQDKDGKNRTALWEATEEQIRKAMDGGAAVVSSSNNNF